MLRLLSIGIDVISAAVVFVPCMMILQCTLYKQMNIQRKVLTILFGLYLTAIFSAVGIPSINSLKVDLSFNWIPFIDILSSPAGYIKNTILNILLFIPIGTLLPIIWNKFSSLKYTAIFGLGLSLAIELLQIFTFRLTDIDDLITNTLGTILGFYIVKILPPKILLNLSAKNTYVRKHSDLFLILVIAFLVMFLVNPFISNILWLFVL